MKRIIPLLFCGLLAGPASHAQTLVDSIPFPNISQGFWGIWATPDTLFLGADFSGDIYFSDHEGSILGQQATGFTYNHGLVRKPDSWLIAKDYTTNGAQLHEIDLEGNLLNTWTFPDVIGGHSSGIGDICLDGDAIWYTMYYPDFSTYPFSYAYKWRPGEATPLDTVPLRGRQPYGIALKGDTLLYVTDDLQGDDERIYSYSLSTREDLGWVDLPDPDGDQSPRGLFYGDGLLYLVADRSGPSAWPFQTVFIYSFDSTVGVDDAGLRPVSIHPNPARDRVQVAVPLELIRGTGSLEVFNETGARIHESSFFGGSHVLDTSTWEDGLYLMQILMDGKPIAQGRFLVVH